MKSIAIIRNKFLIIQCVFVTIAYILGAMGYGSPLYVLLYSIFNILSFSYLFYKEIKYSCDFHPFQILILAVIQFDGINGIDIYEQLNAGESLYFGLYDISDSIWKGMCFLSIEHILLFAGFYYLENRSLSLKRTTLYKNIITSSFPFFSTAIVCYFLVWMVRVLGLFMSLASISSFFVNIASFGQLVSLFLLVFSMLKPHHNPLSGSFLWIITVIEIIFVLNSGMKEFIIRNLIPYCIFLLLMYKNKRIHINFSFILKICLLLCFVFLFVFPYISIYRTLAIEEKIGWAEVSLEKAFDEYSDYLSGTGKYENEDRADMSMNYMMKRAGSIQCNTWAIQYSQENGATPEFLGYVAVGLIPRFIWPDKPNIALGKAMTTFVQGDKVDWTGNDYITEDKSSTTIGFIGGCYFALGIAGALLIPLLMGLFFAFYWSFIKNKLHYNLMALWCLISMIFVIYKDFEGIQDCGLIFVFLSLSYMILTKLLDIIIKAKY